MKPAVIAAALALAAPAAFANPGFDDYARVTDVDPEYEKVNVPRKECYSEYVPESNHRNGRRSLVGPLIGGVAGGLLGSRIGEGSGKVVAAAAGAAIGAIVGDRVGNRDAHADDYYDREVRRCRMVDNWESRITGYRVSYQYQGHDYTTMLPYDPGSRLPVRVNVEPVSTGYRSDERDDWSR